MAETSPEQGRLVSFRLDQVPLSVRQAAARRYTEKEAAVKGLSAMLAAAAVARAAEDPSDRVYRVSEKAWSRVCGPTLP